MTSAPVRHITIKKLPWYRQLWKNRTLIIMCLPVIFFFILFNYVPLPGIYIAFVKYNYAAGIFGSKYIGMENFRPLFMTGKIWELTRNTLLYNLGFIITGNLVQIIMALLFNEMRNRHIKKVSQSLMILPYFISYVLVGLFLYNLMNYDTGIFNMMLRSMGFDRISIYNTPSVWPALLIFINLWKTTGYGTIIYFAAIMGIDAEMLEAAEIDGASTIQRIWYVLLPCMRATIVILILLSLGGIIRGNFDLFYNTAGANTSILFPTTDILETFIFRSLMNNFAFSTAAAVSLYQSVFGFFIVLFFNWLVKKYEPDYALF